MESLAHDHMKSERRLLHYDVFEIELSTLESYGSPVYLCILLLSANE